MIRDTLGTVERWSVLTAVLHQSEMLWMNTENGSAWYLPILRPCQTCTKFSLQHRHGRTKLRPTVTDLEFSDDANLKMQCYLFKE